jgi:hypothetical protein
LRIADCRKTVMRNPEEGSKCRVPGERRTGKKGIRDQDSKTGNQQSCAEREREQRFPIRNPQSEIRNRKAGYRQEVKR